MNVDIEKVHTILKGEVASYKAPVVDLIKIQTNNPFKILIGTILSARTKDQTTLKACRKLFAKVKTFEGFNKVSQKELEKLIYPVGFYRTKTKHLKQLPIVMQERFNGRIPQTIEGLLYLPGVGRKTANLVLGAAFNKPAVCIDTHCHRILNRLGYVKTRTPFETEMQIRKKLPEKYWITLNSYLVAFGQNLCKPLNPKCGICPVYKYCNRVGVKDASPQGSRKA